VYGCFLGLGAFVFGVIRAYAPKLLFMSIFGTIALDIFCSIGPLFPDERYTILNSLLISISCYTAIAVVVTIVVFPQTMNHSCLSATSDLLAKIGELVKIQDVVVDSKPEDLQKGSPLLIDISSKRANIVGSLRQCWFKTILTLCFTHGWSVFFLVMATSGFINLEFSRGKWNGDDVRALETPLLALVSRMGTLNSSNLLA
jgi:hypothetical protein